MNNRKTLSLKRHKGVSRDVLQILFQKPSCTCKAGNCHTHCLALVGLPSVGGIKLPPYWYHYSIVLLEVHFLLPYKLIMTILFWLTLWASLQELLKRETLILKYSQGVKPPCAHCSLCFLWICQASALEEFPCSDTVCYGCQQQCKGWCASIPDCSNGQHHIYSNFCL